ncbi:Tetratricopeptide TPR_2 repeat protein [Desulfosudis oleivorans Hxd3]|uniref:Tetratricopeptide TPR_2 repeat protein n=2 Tax=Desulfosudis TaxID=2904716 RepID=A8ZVN2_DESOH|nr:Tetratricopeptide TPR_2 repeat protein [Desulfosudis oleivorans Hxd3]
MAMKTIHQKRLWPAALAMAVLAALTLGVYHDIGSHAFIEFDDSFFVEAPHVQNGLTLDGLKQSFTTREGMWFPLTWISHMADVHFYGNDPAGHHYTNLFLHLVNTLLLFLVLWRMTGSLGSALAVAALFAVHPLNTETVSYIACRKGLLSTLFWILAMGAYTQYARSPSVGRYLVVTVLLVLGMMAKPMLISLPVILLLLDFWPLGRLSKGRVWDLVKEKMPLLAISLVFLGITVSVQQQTGAITSLAELPVFLRIQNALVSYVLYIGKMLWPVSLAVFYPFPKAIPLWQWAGSATLLVLITTVSWRARTRAPHLIVGWVWYLVTLVPVIGLVKVGQHAMADRYAYIPLIGLFVAIAWHLAGYAAARPGRRFVVWGLAASAVAVLGVMSFRQTGHWKNSTTLFEHTLAVTENNDLIHNNLGKVCFERKNYACAHEQITEALRINPYLPQANYNMGLLLIKGGDTDRAVPYFSRALEVKPDFFDARYALANVFFNKNDFENALNHYIRILKDRETAPAGLLADTHNDMGVIYAHRKKIDVAESHFLEALSLNPGLAAAHNNLGLLLSSRGETGRAEDHFRSAMALTPGFLDAANNLVALYRTQEKYAEAAGLLERLLAERPDSAASIAYNIACLYAVQNDRTAAIMWLERALSSGFDLWPLLERDVDLENIRDTEYYKNLMAGRGDR